jgi:hypothetical protein
MAEFTSHPAPFARPEGRREGRGVSLERRSGTAAEPRGRHGNESVGVLGRSSSSRSGWQVMRCQRIKIGAAPEVPSSLCRPGSLGPAVGGTDRPARVRKQFRTLKPAFVSCGEHMRFSQRLTRPHRFPAEHAHARAVPHCPLRPVPAAATAGEVDQRCLDRRRPTDALCQTRSATDTGSVTVMKVDAWRCHAALSDAMTSRIRVMSDDRGAAMSGHSIVALSDRLRWPGGAPVRHWAIAPGSAPGVRPDRPGVETTAPGAVVSRREVVSDAVSLGKGTARRGRQAPCHHPHVNGGHGPPDVTVQLRSALSGSRR